MKLVMMAMLVPAVIGLPFNVNITSSVVGNVNSTEQSRVCWQDSDCVSYPYCRRQPSNCRCMRTGSCLVVKSYGQQCNSSINCGRAMICLEVPPQYRRNKAKGVCRCEPGTRYSRFLKKCLPITPSIEADMPRFADLPDPGGEDADAPEEIPPTYGGAILVGLLSLGLVLLCLILAMWCHYTSRPEVVPPDDEKIPLDMFLPPPEMYQTPGFQNYLTMNDGVATTSQAHDSFGMLGAEMSRTMR